MLILLVTASPDAPLYMRQFVGTIGASGIRGNTVFSLSATECDVCMVYEGFKTPYEVRCPLGKTLFFAAEPPSIRGYNAGFLARFHQVVICQRQFVHRNVPVQ